MPVKDSAALRARMLALCAAAALAIAGMYGCAGAGPASRPERPPPTPQASPIIAVPTPAAGTPQPSTPAGAMTAPLPQPGAPIVSTAPGVGAPGHLTASAPSDTIALILPLEAPAFVRAAEAVRDGFLGAATAAGDDANCVVIAHGDGGVLAAVEDARSRNVRVIVGPLLRSDVKEVAQFGLDLPYTIALNQLEDGAAAPARLYTFPLAIESDARLLARRLQADGAPQVALVSSETALMKRFDSAFAAQWVALGGAVPNVYRFEGSTEALGVMRRELSRRGPAAVVLALDSEGATLAKPYLGAIPAYASGLVFERVPEAVARDLDGLVLVEIPWIVTPDAPQFADLPRRDFTSAALLRLYALGLDAYRAARALRDGPPDSFVLEGATGRITLDGRQFMREGSLAVFSSGELAPFDGTR
jgi:outer membrane PBP1 activator LpoA protein